MTDRIPVDSAEARELAERDQPDELEHDPRCRHGWLGEDDDGRPIPCFTCRPHLLAAPCRSCGVVADLCSRQTMQGRGDCCTDCNHDRSTR